MLFKEKGSKTGLYIGTAGGFLLFAILGFFPSAMIGGYIGIKLAEFMVGAPAVGILSRLLSAISMLGAVITTGLLFTLGGAIIGWIVGAKFLLQAKETKS